MENDEIYKDLIITKSDEKIFFSEFENFETEFNMILKYSLLLENRINLLIESRAKAINSKKLLKWAEKATDPLTQKLKLLRFADIIDEDTFNDLQVIFTIRNKIAHRRIKKQTFEEALNYINGLTVKVKDRAKNNFEKSVNNKKMQQIELKLGKKKLMKLKSHLYRLSAFAYVSGFYASTLDFCAITADKSRKEFKMFLNDLMHKKKAET